MSRCRHNEVESTPAFEALESRLLLSATFTVTSAADDFDPADPVCDGLVTLREALIAANTDAPAGDAPAGSGADLITFAPELVGETIVLTGRQFEITSELTLAGPGADLLTLDAGGGSRILYVSSSADAVVSGLTFSGGVADVGGGVFNDGGTLELNGCAVIGNMADSLGGGVRNLLGEVTISGCAVVGNIAENGGGVYSGRRTGGDHAMTILNSTISGNVAWDDGGGVRNYPYSVLTMVHCTVTANAADADGDGSGAGGGLANEWGSATLHNCIVAGNTRAGGAAADDLGGEDQDDVEPVSSHNLIGDAATSGGLVDGVSGNLVGADPMLGPLADHGGPTDTHALPLGSPALDAAGATAAVDAGLGTDQRSIGRFDGGLAPADGLPDIGAYERAEAVADANGDGTVGAADIDELFGNLGLTDPAYDLDGDGACSEGDVDLLVQDILLTQYGDTQLDGEVNLLDLGRMADRWNAVQAGWADGDFTGDRSVNLLDLAILADNWGWPQAGEATSGGGSVDGAAEPELMSSSSAESTAPVSEPVPATAGSVDEAEPGVRPGAFEAWAAWARGRRIERSSSLDPSAGFEPLSTAVESDWL